MGSPLMQQRDGPILTLTLNRPERRNALSRALIADLTRVLEGVATTDTRAVILSGAPPAFCSGLDLHELLAEARRAATVDCADLVRLYETLAYLPVPVIAAVGGAATAGGAALLCVCDFVIADADARIGFPGIRHGVLAPIVMPLLRRAITEQHAAYLLLTGECVSAERALAFGLVSEIVGPGQALTRARELAGLIAAAPAEAVIGTRRMLRTLRGLDADALLRVARERGVALTLDAATQESVARFLGGVNPPGCPL